MPDAIYLYKTGYWKDNATRQERIGSTALDYVGKCFNDGDIPACCLMVKFACKKGEFNDNQKWYIYPNITEEQDIWDILNFTFGGVLSIGKGYHAEVHPALKTTIYQRINPPMLRIYTSHIIFYPQNWREYFNGWSTYERIRPFNDITIEAMPFAQANTVSKKECYIWQLYCFKAVNYCDPIGYDRNTPHPLLQNIEHATSSNWTSNNWELYLHAGTPVKKAIVWGMLYNASIILTYKYSYAAPPSADVLTAEINGLSLTPHLSA